MANKHNANAEQQIIPGTIRYNSANNNFENDIVFHQS